jgi:phosphinothricin acetyltransferase
VDQKIAGWFSFEPFRKRPAYPHDRGGQRLRSSRASPKRVGQRLLTEAIRCAPALGLKTLIAGAFAHNEPSLELFKIFGFEPWAHFPRVAELDGVERDLVVLGLRLDERPAPR